MFCGGTTKNNIDAYSSNAKKNKTKTGSLLSPFLLAIPFL